MLNALTGKKSVSTVGIAIGQTAIEAILYRPGTDQPFKFAQVPVGQELLTPEGDQVHNPTLLATLIRQALTEVGATNQKIHVTIPGTLVRLVDLPKMQRHEMYLSLSSEAERYKAFDGSEALVDFQILEKPGVSGLQQRVIFTAIRKDTLAAYHTAFKRARINVASLDIDEHSILRAMAATGVLDSLLAQIGTSGLWGSLFSANGRIRLMVWQGNQIQVMRELNLASNGNDWDQTLVEDLTEEIRRTGQALQGEYPVAWLTHRIPDSVSEALTDRFGSPFTPCQMVLPSAQGPQSTLASAGFGAALHNELNFPFSLNLNRGKSLAKNADEAKATLDNGAPDAQPVSAKLWIGSAIAAGLVLVVGVGSLLFAGLLGGDINRLEAEKASASGQIAQLTGQYNQLKQAYELKASLIAVADKAQIRNQIAVAVGQDLKRLTPPSVWLNEIDVTDELTLVGDALHHGGAINFARNLDDTQYAASVKLDEMKEGFLGDNPIYNFKVKSSINLNPELLPRQPEPAKTAVAPVPATP